MNRALAILAVIAIAMAACGQPLAETRRTGGDPVVNFSKQDAGMNAASAEARRTLPLFWKWLASGNPALTGAGLKVGLATPAGDVEHIWVSDIDTRGGKIAGRLANAPDNLPGLSDGSPIEIDPKLISDWTLVIGDRSYGSFTTRYMLDHAEIDGEEAIRADLSDTPVPSEP